MENRKNTVRIELTEEQRRQLEQATGKQASAIEFSAEELEERIAPAAAVPGVRPPGVG